MEKKDAAFPVFCGNEHSPAEGMSKRFYAACAAMHSILSANPKETWGSVNLPVSKYIAELSYEFADELLKQENE
jgi:hypothetical protein